MLAKSDKAPIRVNVGCGATPTAGWVNIDNSPSVRLARFRWLWPLLDRNQRRMAQEARGAGIQCGSATKLRLASASVDVLYSSHMMEHLDRREAESFVREVVRVLRPGGVLRLALPDLRKHALAYVKHQDADRFISAIMMGTSRPRSLKERLQNLFVGPRHHLWMYDGASLTRLLGAHGFINVSALPAGATRIGQPGGLDLREREDESVYVEAVKAG